MDTLTMMTGSGLFVETVPLSEFEEDTAVMGEWQLWAMLIMSGWPDFEEERDAR